MKRIMFVFTMLLSALTITAPLQASAQLTALQILEKVDINLHSAKDQHLMTTITLYGKSGVTGTRTMELFQQGSDKRLVKFLSPADQKGIGFLSLPNDNLTVYLPGFGKTRKIASSVKNTRFAGTVYSYEDMEAKRYAVKYDPLLLKSFGGFDILQLTPKNGVNSEYSKLIMYIRSADHYPVKVEYYDKNAKLYKSMIASNIVRVGDYLIAKETMLEDHKNGQKTKMVITSVEFDQGISDDKFTERELLR